MRQLSVFRPVSLELVLILTLAGCGGNTAKTPQADVSRKDSPQVAPEVERLKEFFPVYQVTKEKKEPFPYLTVLDSAGTQLGFQIESDQAAVTDSGYMGKVPVRVYLDPKAQVLGFDVLDNYETPAYLRLALCDSLTDRLKRYRPGSGDSMDAVTMATKTSKAIIHAVTRVADLVAAQLAAQDSGQQ
jgi:Na+-translocating ferredoxin:NAD+ oxidoreductase RnfG subunit